MMRILATLWLFSACVGAATPTEPIENDCIPTDTTLVVYGADTTWIAVGFCIDTVWVGIIP